jgi:putative RecB family exonuclease
VFKISPYKLGVFQLCPQQYKFIYLDGLLSAYRQHRPYFTMGEHVHATLKDFLSVIPPEKRNHQTASQLLRLKWARNRQGFRDREDEKKWGEKALLQLENFVRREDLSLTPFLVEDYHEIEIEEDLILLGRIDRVDKKGKSLQVIDYKTGKLKPQEVDPLQLYCYALILERKFQLPVTSVAYYFLGENKILTYQPTRKTLQKALASIKDQVAKILKEKAFLAAPNRYCSTCDFLEICPKKKEAANQEKLSNEELPF